MLTYKSLLVHLSATRSNKGLLQIAGDIAEMFDSSIVGIAASQPAPFLYSAEFPNATIYDIVYKQLEASLTEAESECRKALQARVKMLEWRASITLDTVANFIAHEARGSDLIITNAKANEHDDSTSDENPGDLVMQSGRPVLLVPENADALKLDHLMLAWKDTREAQRAATGALPFMKMAKRVTVFEIAEEQDHANAAARLKDVTEWLTQHEITSQSTILSASGDDTEQLADYINMHKTDVLVAGAYGHSRFREWVLGGVTRDLLVNAGCCTLLSH